jgi:hypothetical protein
MVADEGENSGILHSRLPGKKFSFRRVGLNFPELLFGEAPGLVENIRGNSSLSKIVQQSSNGYRFEKHRIVGLHALDNEPRKECHVEGVNEGIFIKGSEIRKGEKNLGNPSNLSGENLSRVHQHGEVCGNRNIHGNTPINLTYLGNRMPGERAIQLLSKGKLQTFYDTLQLIQGVFVFSAHQDRGDPSPLKLAHHQGKRLTHRIKREVSPLGKQACLSVRGHDILGYQPFAGRKMFHSDSPYDFHVSVPPENPGRKPRRVRKKRQVSEKDDVPHMQNIIPFYEGISHYPISQKG